MDLTDIKALPKYYKKIPIYPVKLNNIDKFYKYAECLLFNKNKIQDINIIKMSYLRFMIEYSYLKNPEGKSFEYILDYFYKLSELVFGETIELKSDGTHIFLKINDKLLDEYEFDRIRDIILQQNMIKISDIMDEEVEKELKKTEDFLNKKNPPANLEELIISYHIATGINYNDIFNYSIYQFNKSLERLSMFKTWEVYAYPAIKSGEIDKLQHWLSHIDETDMIDKLTVSKEEFDKITADSGIFSK